MKRKPKTAKAKLNKKADNLWRDYIKRRDENTCQYCKLVKGVETQGIQAHHIFSRKYKRHNLRWNPLNGVGLCWPCHLNIAHGDPERFRDFLIDCYIGETVYNKLKREAYDTTGPKGDPAAAIERLEG
jgi:hypothetical protein